MYHMAMVAPVYYTAEMVRQLPEDGNRYETVRGELLVTPAPRMWHQVILERLRDALKVYLARHPDWYILSAPADISPGPDVLVQPDLFVVPLQEARTLDWARLTHLELVVEVLSDATARADRFAKRCLYQDMGVPTYWIVDADEHVVETWTPEQALPTVEHEQLAWLPSGATSPLVLSLAEFFRPL
jgi:Uma2 family endonuclease